MGRIKKAVEHILKEESLSDGMKEFNVKVIEPNGSSWVGYVKARTAEAAINKMKEAYGTSANEKSYIIV